MIRAILLVALSAAIVLPAHAREMNLRMLQFYESGFKPASKNQRRYVSLLPRSSTRYVYWEMTVRNHLYNVRDHTHTVVARWYRSNGTRIGQTTQTFRVQSRWYNAWASHGWGFRQPGRWRPGKYRVDILVDGKIYTRRHFLIYDDAVFDPNNQQFAFTRVRLFEGGFRPAPAAQRRYLTSFDRSTTRYIYAEVAGRNLAYGQRSFYPIVLVRFFKDDGAYAGEIILNRAIVRSTWRSALLAGGWGASTPNTWAAGRYKVEVWTSNTRKVGETRFVVHTGNQPANRNPQDDQKGPEGMTDPDKKTPDTKPPEDKPQAKRPADKQPGTQPGAVPVNPAKPAPKAPDKEPSKKPRDLEELEKL